MAPRDPLPAMPPVSHNILRIVQSWQDQQAPLVRALTAPMVEDVAAALEGVQQLVDEQEAELTAQQGRLREVLARLEAMEKSSKAAAEVSQALVADLTAKLEATTDRIDVLERKQYGRQSEKRKKTPDARRGARKRRSNERTDEEKKARRKAAEAKRQAKLDALRTVSITLPLPDSVGDGRQMPPVVSTLYEWQPGELVRIELSREQRATAEGFIATAPPVDQVVEGGCYGPALYAKICVDKCLNAMPLRRQERGFLRLGAPLPMSTLCALFHRAGDLVSPIYDALQAHVATAPHVQADETPLPVLDEHRTRKGWMVGLRVPRCAALRALEVSRQGRATGRPGEHQGHADGGRLHRLQQRHRRAGSGAGRLLEPRSSRAVRCV